MEIALLQNSRNKSLVIGANLTVKECVLMWDAMR